eukprot:TRINITY_DN21112_c0_g1_i3.p1 TRINITY_DN21112_c0_g1~~TRINITY_DN21112_c0_g1_i3.p1  ORF type:complete len:240 (+),score=38.56 TRINITY_DN21112_c0_g1_i3:81-722(+)
MAQLDGRLFAYHKTPAGLQLVAFQHGCADRFPLAAVFVPGLTDGLLSAPYLGALAEALAPRGWTLVQPVLSSSWLGYGTSSLTQDAAELDCLLRWLQAHRGVTAAALIGHSTGCQDAITALRARAGGEGMLCAAVLQGSVSDREYLATLPQTAEHLAAARAMRDRGESGELMPRSADPAPITASWGMMTSSPTISPQKSWSSACAWKCQCWSP